MYKEYGIYSQRNKLQFGVTGYSVLQHACDAWQKYPSEARLKVVRFLVEAGADALLFADATTRYSAHDTLALGLFSNLLSERDSSRSLATSVRTNAIALDIFRSLFNMDAMDALEDLLSREYGHSDEDTLHILTSLETTETLAATSHVFKAINYTPLEYAIKFSPSNVESIIAEGADVTAEPTLAYASCVGSVDVIKSLVDRGADVNIKGYLGRAALHWACHACLHSIFLEFIRCAKDKIDWNARTPDGQNALDLFEMGVSEGSASDFTSGDIYEFRSTLLSHMDPSQSLVAEDKPLHMPGALAFHNTD